MSHYPEADEAQHRYYNDGFAPYSTTPRPDSYNSYDNNQVEPFNRYATPLADPFNPPAQDPFNPPPQNPYIRPAPPPSSVGFQYVPPTYHPGYDEQDHDTGDIPLLRRGPSASSTGLAPGARVPGSYDSDEDEPSNIRYGRIPQRVPRRYKTVKKFELFHGNFVLDNPVPKKLLDMCSNRTEREFTHMRYSAATCDPNDFKDSGFTLRQSHYDPPRRTELFIVMTMYNEDEELFCRSMHGVIKNIVHLCKRDRSKTWGKEGWKKVVVCIVSDGRGKVNSRTLSVIATMGAYQEGVAKTKIGQQDVTAHIYEYTTQISVNPHLKIEGAEKGIIPVQIIFCLKEKNQKKSTLTDGSSTLSVPFFSPMFVFSWMWVLCQVQRVSIIYGKLSISIRMLEVLVEKLWP
jgi:chitin synthase